uniref:Uncharacterized protein n=1 Tax=Oryza meridionalis TaxID=40149 RepID=A0A0E0EDQ0_9ORYZ
MARDWTSVRGVSGGGGGRHGAMRRDRRRRPRCEEERPGGGCGVVFGARRLAGGGRRCSGSTCQQRLSGGGASVRDERRVKTLPGLAGPTTMFPLLRALSCHLIPQGCLPGENPVLAFLSP